MFEFGARRLTDSKPDRGASLARRQRFAGALERLDDALTRLLAHPFLGFAKQRSHLREEDGWGHLLFPEAVDPVEPFQYCAGLFHRFHASARPV